ncbi:restriction endonuclease subunit S [Collinsella sp. CLA-JM-H32B]|uniref:restriction endonuclease subunit S n=1 Tax=Collinsella sp. CLA-JM-H32B TaxID=3136221 RepID=UPI0032C1AD59
MTAWEQRKLGSIAASFDYGLNAAATEYDGQNKYLRITDIDDTTHEFLKSDLTTPLADLAMSADYLLEEGDLLFARTGASVGKTYLYRQYDGTVYFAGFLIRARIGESADPEFVYQATLTDAYKKYVAITSQRSGQPGVNAQEYADYQLMLPSRTEQQQIGMTLRSLDNLITLHQRKCQYRGLYEYLSWEQRKFSDLTDRVSIQSSDSDLPQVEYEDIVSGEGTLNKDLRDKEGGKTGIKFYAGDVLYGKLRPYLMNWLYPQFNGVAVGDFWVLRATKCDSSFLYRLIQTNNFQRLANVSSGSKMPRADWNLISQSFFAVPADHAEQKAIAKSLAELDSLITLHQ